MLVKIWILNLKYCKAKLVICSIDLKNFAKKKYEKLHEVMMVDLHDEIFYILNNETPEEMLNKTLTKFDILEFSPITKSYEAKN